MSRQLASCVPPKTAVLLDYEKMDRPRQNRTGQSHCDLASQRCDDRLHRVLQHGGRCEGQTARMKRRWFATTSVPFVHGVAPSKGANWRGLSKSNNSAVLIYQPTLPCPWSSPQKRGLPWASRTRPGSTSRKETATRQWMVLRTWHPEKGHKGGASNAKTWD